MENSNPQRIARILVLTYMNWSAIVHTLKKYHNFLIELWFVGLCQKLFPKMNI